MLEEDLPVFFTDFGMSFVHHPSGTVFQAIKGLVDVAALDGYALNAEVVIRYQTCDIAMREGEMIYELDALGDVVCTWVLLEHPRRQLDGSESEVILGSVQS